MPDIIADFHGTLYADADEVHLWEYVAKRALKSSLSFRPVRFHPIRLASLAIAKPLLEGLLEHYKRGEIGYDKIYETYNRWVLAHLPLKDVRRYTSAYAREARRGLEEDIINAINYASGKKGILSTGSKDFMHAISFQFILSMDVVDANKLVADGRGSRLELTVYDNKPKRIEEIFYHKAWFNPKKTIYIGDNADEEPAMEYIVANGGGVVMPFLASDEFKQHCAKKYKAEVPKDERELRLLLK